MFKRIAVAIATVAWASAAVAQIPATDGNWVVGDSLSFGTVVPRAVAPPPDSYLIPQFTVLIGGGAPTSARDPLFQRLFASIAGQSAKAVAITAQFAGFPEIPVLIIERDGNTFSQHSVVGLSAAPALVYPGKGQVLTLRMRYATSFDSSVGQKLQTAVTTAATVYGGVPALLLSPVAAAAATEIDNILKAAFKTSTSYELVVELNEPMVSGAYRQHLVFYDRPRSDAKHREIARLQIDLPVKPSLFLEPNEQGKFSDPNPGAVLGWTRKGDPPTFLPITIDRTLQDRVPQYVTMHTSPTATAQQYLDGCHAVRPVIQNLGLTQADVSILYYSVIKTSLAPMQPGQCPSEEDQNQMRRYGLPALALNVWDLYYYPALIQLAGVLRSGNGLAELVSDPSDYVRFKQNAGMISGLEVGKEYRFTAEELAAHFGKVKATDVAKFYYLDDGLTTIRKLVVGGNTFKADVSFKLEVSTGPPQRIVPRLREIIIQP